MSVDPTSTDPTNTIAADRISRRSLLLALAVEGGLGVVALFAGWLLSHWPATGMGWAGISSSAPPAGEQVRAIGIGVLATIPPLVVLAVIDRLPLSSLERVRQLAETAIRQMFPQPQLWQLALVAAAAGLGEELLFRGLVQAGLARLLSGIALWDIALGPWIALVVASLIFGLFHWLSRAYALLAALAGLYFGLVLMATGSLWPSIVAHALYDFVALWYLLRPNQMVELKV